MHANLLRCDDARDALLDACTGLKLDILIVGSRGLGPVKRMLLGSVSNYLVEHAPCPVVVVRQFDKSE